MSTVCCNHTRSECSTPPQIFQKSHVHSVHSHFWTMPHVHSIHHKANYFRKKNHPIIERWSVKNSAICCVIYFQMLPRNLKKSLKRCSLICSRRICAAWKLGHRPKGCRVSRAQKNKRLQPRGHLLSEAMSRGLFAFIVMLKLVTHRYQVPGMSLIRQLQLASFDCTQVQTQPAQVGLLILFQNVLWFVFIVMLT